MDTFSYKGISDGKYVEGEIEALNQDEASHKLKEQKVIITNLIKSKKKKDKDQKKAKGKKGGGFSIANGEEFYIQISSLLNEEDVFLRSSYSATNVVHDNLGSSTRIVRSLIHD